MRPDLVLQRFPAKQVANLKELNIGRRRKSSFVVPSNCVVEE